MLPAMYVVFFMSSCAVTVNIIIFIYMCVCVCVRLGPSASEAAAGAQDDMLVQLVKSLSHLKSAIDDPKMRAVIKTLAPQLITVLGDRDDDREVARAHAGEPTSSRPGRKPEEPEPLNEVPKVPMPPPPAPVPKEDKPVVAPADATSPDGVAPFEAEVNSSTHRAAHARLTRRMERCTAINFPNMSRLWNGSRKDTYGW